MTSDPSALDSLPVSLLRRGVLAVLLFGVAGTTVELYLLEHFDGWKQWVPLGLLALGVPACTVALWRPGPLTLRLLTSLMVAFLVSGAVGAWFHYRGNVEFELERTPELAGFALFHAAMEGATPALAPGTMIQFGLIGLLFTWRHPAWRKGLTPPHTP